VACADGAVGRAIALALLLAPFAVRAQDTPQLVSPDQDRFRIDGSVEYQLRGLADGLDPGESYLSQSAFVLNLEPELDLVIDGWGPFDLVSAFARIEARYDCVFNGCGTLGTTRVFGDHAKRSPARNWADGPTLAYVGGIDLRSVGQPVHHVQSDDRELLPITANPAFRPYYDLGIDPATVAAAFGPTAGDLFTWKRIDGPRSGIAVPLGPWPYGSKIRPNGALRAEVSTTSPLPLRPAADSLYTPSAALRRRIDRFDSFDQNFGEHELAWNRGGSQDEWELKEAYLDVEMLDSRLWVRLGKQNIVWGKTELFRTTGQFNPVDIGLASLPSLEESRVALWSARAVYSLFDVGPFQDVRVEVAANLDDFEPIDTGRCGEPYTIWPVCVKSTGLWAHGTSGAGIAGEEHPPAPWESAKGVEIGGRVEFRWQRFSFAVMNFWGYEDVPSFEMFNEFQRSVDPTTGRPLGSGGRPLTPETALEFEAGNRQGFDLGCKASLGFGENALLVLTGGEGEVPDLSNRCLGDLTNIQEPLLVRLAGAELEVPVTNGIGALASGQLVGTAILALAQQTLGIPSEQGVQLVPLVRDPADGPPGGSVFGADPLPGFDISLFTEANLSMYLSDEQEALLGCGPFFATDCDVDGIDLFHTEASVLLQALPGFASNPVATRFVAGRQVILPGARSPDDPGYDQLQDGTPPPGFASEMAALSANFVNTLALLGIAEGDTDCDLLDLATCAAVQALASLTGSTRPEVRAGGNGAFGRRDFQFHGGGEAAVVYPKRNVLGFSADFAEDLFLTSSAFEFTWVHGAPYASNRSDDLLQETDVLNLTVSIDRPTFIRFLNENRTFFFNTQIFLRYIVGHDSSFDVNGPFTALGTFTVATGYFQDRLLPAATWVHDVRSGSGALVGQISYRFSETFSATVGLLAFYGQPDDNRLPTHPIALPDTQTDFDARTRYEGLSAIAERDEVFLKLRYTF
jgi:hypothetical protein